MTDLWQHQKDFLAFAEDKSSVLANHPMGAGKSLSTISLLDRDDANLVIIIAPLAATTIWGRQFKHSTRPWIVWSGEVYGTSGRRLRNPTITQRAGAIRRSWERCRSLSQPFAVVLNYEAAPLEPLASLLRALPASHLVLDEVHKLKSPSGRNSRWIGGLSRASIARRARVIALSGTPMAQSPLDLFGVARGMGIRLAPSYRAFCQEYGQSETIYVSGGITRTIYKTVRPEALPRLLEATSSWMHIVTPEQARLSMPDAVDVEYSCELEPKTRALYNELRDELIAEFDQVTTVASNPMVLALRLAQLACGFMRDADSRSAVPVGNEKRDLLERVAGDISDPLVVFCRFHSDLDSVRLVANLLGRRYMEISGRRKDGLTENGEMSPDCDMLGVQISSGGTGISLVRSNVAIYYSMDYKLSDYLQSRARLVRPGQTRSCVFVHLTVQDTIEQSIYAALKQRQEVIDSIVAYLRGGALVNA